MHIYFNPLDLACKNQLGGVKEGDKIQLNLYLLKNEAAINVYHLDKGNLQLTTPDLQNCTRPANKGYLCLNKDGEAVEEFPMLETDFGWSITLSIHEIGLYFYCFRIESVGFASCKYMELGEISPHPNGFLLTVYSQDYHTPNWFKGGVMYQIFPDRFNKKGTLPDIEGRIKREDWGGLPTYKPNAQGKVLNNDFFGGNFKGIQEKLPYLKELGITVIYCNPIFEAASNHRYDTSDYMKIDPYLGSEEDFKEFIDVAKTYGIRVILDGVFNHTGDNSVYFNKYGKYSSIGAYQSKDSPYYSWYTFQEFPNKYSSWWGIDILPEVNEYSEDYQRFIFDKGGVLKKWLGFGIGGYRLDVADELPDFFLKKLRKSVKEEDPNAIIIGEVWEDASNKIAYSTRREYLQGYELDSVMNYPLKDAIIQYMQRGNALELLNVIRVLINHYPKETLDSLMNILGTHDTARILSVLGEKYCKNKDEMAQESAYLDEKSKKSAIKKLKMAVILQYMLPGVPCIYYGDENAMEGHIDPFCRRCFDWEHLNNDLIEFYQTLGKLREKYREILQDGIFKEICVNDGLLFFKRKKENSEIFIYTNNSANKYIINFSEIYQDCISGEIFKNNYLEIQPNSYRIFVKV